MQEQSNCRTSISVVTRESNNGAGPIQLQYDVLCRPSPLRAFPHIRICLSIALHPSRRNVPCHVSKGALRPVWKRYLGNLFLTPFYDRYKTAWGPLHLFLGTAPLQSSPQLADWFCWLLPSYRVDILAGIASTAVMLVSITKYLATDRDCPRFVGMRLAFLGSSHISP